MISNHWNDPGRLEESMSIFRKLKGTLSILLLALLLALGQPAIAAGAAELPAVYAEADFASLEIGDKGAAVEALQLRLKELGYLDDKADGFFGKNTRNALVVFQIANQLEGTGVASPADQCVLFNAGALSATGEEADAYSPEISAATVEPTEAPAVRTVERNYIGNRNTGKFHYPSCSSVKQMKESNKISLTYDEAISGGYVPCKRCNP